jgi:hypothetical protein
MTLAGYGPLLCYLFNRHLSYLLSCNYHNVNRTQGLIQQRTNTSDNCYYDFLRTSLLSSNSSLVISPLA